MLCGARPLASPNEIKLGHSRIPSVLDDKTYYAVKMASAKFKNRSLTMGAGRQEPALSVHGRVAMRSDRPSRIGAIRSDVWAVEGQHVPRGWTATGLTEAAQSLRRLSACR